MSVRDRVVKILCASRYEYLNEKQLSNWLCILGLIHLLTAEEGINSDYLKLD